MISYLQGTFNGCKIGRDARVWIHVFMRIRACGVNDPLVLVLKKSYSVCMWVHAGVCCVHVLCSIVFVCLHTDPLDGPLLTLAVKISNF